MINIRNCYLWPVKESSGRAGEWNLKKSEYAVQFK